MTTATTDSPKVEIVKSLAMTIFYNIFRSWSELQIKHPNNGMSTAEIFVLLKCRKTEDSLGALDKKFDKHVCWNTIQGESCLK